MLSEVFNPVLNPRTSMETLTPPTRHSKAGCVSSHITILKQFLKHFLTDTSDGEPNTFEGFTKSNMNKNLPNEKKSSYFNTTDTKRMWKLDSLASGSVLIF